MKATTQDEKEELHVRRQKMGGGGEGWGVEQTPSNIQESASYDSQQNVHISCVLFNAITTGRVAEVICFVCRSAGMMTDSQRAH
jgi:hypothetical protein